LPSPLRLGTRNRWLPLTLVRRPAGYQTLD
jgi:hypothetical protein